MVQTIKKSKAEKQDICPNCDGFMKGLRIKFNLKDLRECRGCKVFNIKP